MMFDVLAPDLNLDTSYLIEASAGTGKTFTIEHLVVRLLLQGMTIDQLLVVTFTQAAAQELRVRVRLRLESALEDLKSRESTLPYLSQLIDDEEERHRAYWALENALYCFEEGNLLTIHSFCAQELRERQFEGAVKIDEEKGMIPPELISRIIKDHFRLKGHTLSEGQIKRLLKSYWGSFDRLEKALFRVITQPLPIVPGPAFPELLSSFQNLRECFSYSSDRLLEDFEMALPHHKKMKGEDIEAIHRFFSLFDKPSWNSDDLDQLINDGLPILEMTLKKKNAYSPEALHYPQFMSDVQSHLEPLVKTARDSLTLLSTLAHHCQALLQRYMKKEGIYPYDTWLTELLNAIQEPKIAQSIRSSYGAVIIDEFQDTDPIQWKIFQTLFLHKVPLYLVGDPKQSIYAFRSADLYTYFEAAAALQRATLQVNYRSTPELIAGLNHLFERAPCFHLPRTNQSLDYHPVTSGCPSTDGKPSIHWISTTLPDKKTTRSLSQKELISHEECLLLPVMAAEIINQRYPHDTCAVLVRDRFQGQRVRSVFEQWGIPVVLQRTENLLDSPAREVLTHLLQSALYPSDLSYIKCALGGQAIQWSLECIGALDQPHILATVIEQWWSLHRLLFERGIGPFFEQLLQTWFASHPPIEISLIQNNNSALLSDLEQLVEVLMDLLNRFPRPPHQWINLIDRLEEFLPEGCERRQDPSEPGVRVLTMHMSKGLEFDHVFALGLMSRTPLRDELIPTPEKYLSSPLLEPEAHHLYLQEIDAEKMRQLYVAVTRAKHHLYLPIIWTLDRQLPPLGSASPMELWCQHLSITPDNPPLHPSMEWSTPTKAPSPTPHQITTISPTLTPPTLPIFTFPNRTLHSFTSLSKPNHTPLLLDPPHNFLAESKTAHTLPAGSHTGELIHTLFEKLPSDTTSYLINTPFHPWKSVIDTLIQTTLTTPLSPTSFSFNEINPSKIYREVEFLHDSLKGVIDCVFEHNGKTYILDWKTNWLGPDLSFYTHDHLFRAMTDNDYHLQGSIYTNAWKQYQSHFSSLPFGGVFYLFVRGVSPTTGVYHFFPEEIQ